MKLLLGHGFADVRKQHVMSKYRGVVAREKKNLGAWSEKLKKIYAESEQHTADEDPLERFAKEKRKKKRQKNGTNVSAVHEPCQKEIVTTAVLSGDKVSSQSSAAKTSTEKPSAVLDNSRFVHFYSTSGREWSILTSMSACLFLFTRISQELRVQVPNFTKFSLRVFCGRYGSFLAVLYYVIDTFCFVDDVTFFCSGFFDGVTLLLQPRCSVVWVDTAAVWYCLHPVLYEGGRQH